MKETQITKEEFSYDSVAYPGLIIPQTSPDRLAAIAKFCGMNPVSAEKCRVLELGCGDGSNSLWLASYLPESEFIGIDLAQFHINEARKSVNELGLRNITFHQQDVMEITEQTFGKFDYIIAHGLYSWVPEIVREKILSLYDELLNPEGVGFISYNTYPGFYRRQIVRDMMKFHTKRLEKPMEKVHQGIELIEFLTQNTNTSTAYHELLNYELKGLSNRPVEITFHDDLSEINQPFYFTDFMAEAEKHNLQFLSESESFPAQKDGLPGEIAETFENISRNTIEFEQFIDFLHCRRFRQTLLCKNDVNLETEIIPLKIKDFYISSLINPTSPNIDLNQEMPKEFIAKNGDTFQIRHNLTKVALSLLVNAGDHALKFTDLVKKADEILRMQGYISDDLEKDIAITAAHFVQIYSPVAIGLHTSKSNVVNYVSEKPVASKFAVWKLNKGDLATNFYGVDFNIQDGFTLSLINLLDGTRTREDLIKDLTEIINSNNEIADKEVYLAEMPENLDRDLFVLAKMGLLIG